jgi:hypothetical protein
MRVDAATYRNLALRRAAKHSSSYDYNLTAQLVTDGIKETRMPRWVAVSTSGDGVLTKPDREIVLDHFPPVGMTLKGATVSVEVQVGGGVSVPAVDKLRVFVALPEYVAAKDLRFAVEVSEDGRAWEEVGSAKAEAETAVETYPPDLLRGTKIYYPWLALKRVCAGRFYRVTCACGGREGEGLAWMVGQVEFWRGAVRVEIGGPYEFTSAWMSAGLAEEWVSVDLGARCVFDRVDLYWIARAAEGSVQVSDDEVKWTEVHKIGASVSAEGVEEIRLAVPARGRYVRVLMTRPASGVGYVLSELEVWGRGGVVAVEAEMPAMVDGQLRLAGGGWGGGDFSGWI